MLGTARQYLFTFALVSSVAGCGENVSAPPEVGYRPGSPDFVTVVAIDEVTRQVIPGVAVEVFDADGTIITGGTTDAFGVVQLSGRFAFASVVLSNEGYVTERWAGTGREIIVPLQRRAVVTTVTGTLEDVPAGEWTVVATSPARVLHAASLATSSSAPCVVTGTSCTFTIETAVEPTSTLVAFRSDAGVPTELRVLGDIDDPASLDDAIRFEVAEVDVSIPDPGAGATAVVGVPGIAVSGRVAVLPWPMGEASMRLPDTEAEMGSAWALFSTTLADGGTSVLVQRGAAGEALDAWTEWLAAPTVETTDGLSISHTGVVALLAVAWYDDAVLIQNDLGPATLGGLAGIGTHLTAPAGATSAVVRVIDTTGIEAGTLSLDLAERSVTRIAERTVTLP